MATPTSTVPNVVIENPKARRIARTILDVGGLILGTVIVVDGASDAFNVLHITAPLSAAYLYLRNGFGLLVDNPNTPKF